MLVHLLARLAAVMRCGLLRLRAKVYRLVGGRYCSCTMLHCFYLGQRGCAVKCDYCLLDVVWMRLLPSDGQTMCTPFGGSQTDYSFWRVTDDYSFWMVSSLFSCWLLYRDHLDHLLCHWLDVVGRHGLLQFKQHWAQAALGWVTAVMKRGAWYGEW
jgi:hypothetical protein